MINKEYINYIENMSKELIRSLKESLIEYQVNNHYIYSSSNRAKFKRLRVELTKELMKVEQSIYRR